MRPLAWGSPMSARGSSAEPAHKDAENRASPSHDNQKDMTMKRLSSLAALLVTLFIIGVGPVLADSLTLRVEGMTCSMCPKAVKKALERTEGVKQADVSSYKDGKAIVEYNADKTSPEELIRAVGKAGYRASEIKAD